MKIVLGILRISYLVLIASLVNADTGEQSPAEALAEKLQGLQTFSANFSQTISADNGKQLQQASGIIQVKRPNKLYWLTNAPYQHLVVTDGESLWLHDIDLEQINKQPYSADLDHAPALLLSGNIAEIEDQYTIEQNSSDMVVEFILTPKNGDGVFKQLSVVFQDGIFSSMYFSDGFDQRTAILFSDAKANIEIADSLLEFIPPAGIDVIEDDG